MWQKPKFVVRAAGSLKQLSGCSDESIDSLSPKRLEYLCAGECYNPSNERHKIERIEVIKITPQSYAGEEIDPLIQDSWRIFDCSNSSECYIEFEDENYSRDSVYYVRAIQEATMAINGAQTSSFKQEFKLCKGSFRTDLKDDCLYPANERAWSSPIFLNKP